MTTRQTLSAAAALIAAALTAKIVWYGLAPTLSAIDGGDKAVLYEMVIYGVCLLVALEGWMRHDQP